MFRISRISDFGSRTFEVSGFPSNEQACRNNEVRRGFNHVGPGVGRLQRSAWVPCALARLWATSKNAPFEYNKQMAQGDPRVMAISIKCSGCGGLLEVGNEYAGKPVRCKRCQTVLTVPAEPASAEIDVVAKEPVAQEATNAVTGRPTTSAPPSRRPRNWDDDPPHKPPSPPTPQTPSSSPPSLLPSPTLLPIL